MFIPILHERMVVSQWPWVSIAILLACLLIFPITAWNRADEESSAHFSEAVAFALTHPDTKVDERLMTPALEEEIRAWVPEEAVAEGADDEALSPQETQEELDRLTSVWLSSTESAPSWRFGLVPARLRPEAAITHQFLHGDLFHLFGNLLMLYLTAPLVEDRIGRGRFALLYLGLGALAGIAYALHFPALFRPLIGASGAISAVVGLFVVLYAGIKLQYLLWIGLPLGVFTAPAWVMFPVWFAMQLAFGLQESSATEAGLGGVAYWAHAWGFAGGVVAGLLLRKRSPQIEVAAPDPLVAARRLVAQGRRDDAWKLLADAVRGGDDREEAIRELWQLARLTGRTAEAAPAFARLVRRELRAVGPDGLDPSSVYRAADLWQELKAALKERPVDPAISLLLVDAFVKLDEAREQREEILADALAGVKPASAPQVVASLVRLASGARSGGVKAALDAARARLEGTPALREALGGANPAASAS